MKLHPIPPTEIVTDTPLPPAAKTWSLIWPVVWSRSYTTRAGGDFVLAVLAAAGCVDQAGRAQCGEVLAEVMAL
jgi:hypothetical protein